MALPPKRKRGRPRKNEAASPPIGDMTEIQKWRTRVARARELRKNWERKFRVIDLELMYLGFQKENQEDLVLNKFLSTIQTIRPNLFLSEPKFFVRPASGLSGPVHDHHAAIGEGVLESIARQDGNLKVATKLALSQAFFRIGVLKACYDPKMEPNPQAGLPVYETDGAGHPVMDMMKARPLRNPETGEPLVDPQTRMPVIDPLTLEPKVRLRDDGQPLVEPEEIVSDEIYAWDWVNARNMLLPDEGPDMRRWTWIGEEIVVPIAEAKADPRFPKALREKLEANESPLGGASDRGEYNLLGLDPTLAGKELGRLRYFECYDHEKKEIVVFTDGSSDVDEFLMKEPLPAGIEENPYSLLAFLPMIGPDPFPWPLPFTYNWLDPQREWNSRRTQMMEGAKRSARKIYYEQNTFPDTDNAVKALRSSRDMEGVELSDVTRPPLILTDPPLPPNVAQDIAMLAMDWIGITGQTGARLSAASGATATESTFLERASNLRDAELQDATNDWLGTAGKKMFRLVRATLNLSVWVKLRGVNDSELNDYLLQRFGMTPEQAKFLPGLAEGFRERYGKDSWQSATRELLDFEAEVTIVPGSARPKNLDSERRQTLEFLTLLGQFPQIGLSRRLLGKLGAMFEIVDAATLDEIHALANKMVEIQANVAGRNQGKQAEEPTGSPIERALEGLVQGAQVRQ